jgi:hypothetical protein
MNTINNDRIAQLNAILSNTITNTHTGALQTKESLGIPTLEDSILLATLVDTLPKGTLSINEDAQRWLYEMYDSAIQYIDNFCYHEPVPTQELAQIVANLTKVYEAAR